MMSSASFELTQADCGAAGAAVRPAVVTHGDQMVALQEDLLTRLFFIGTKRRKAEAKTRL